MARSTIGRGPSERGGETAPSESGRVRRPGGGRKPETEKQPELLSALEALGRAHGAGRSGASVALDLEELPAPFERLEGAGFSVSRTLVGKLLAQLGYTLQGSAKTREGTDGPDRMASSSTSTTMSRTSWPAGNR